MQVRMARLAGTALLAGVVTWALTFVVWPSTPTYNSPAEIAGGLAFQLGVGAYLATVGAAGAAGRRWGPKILAGQAVLLLLAMVWSVGTVITPRFPQPRYLMVLDAAWPLSMLGLVVVAVAVLRAGGLRGISRFAPLTASLWLLADVLGELAGVARVVHVVWLIASYGWLGLALVFGQLREQDGFAATTSAEPHRTAV